MKKVSEDFTLHVDSVKGVCPAAEAWAEQKFSRRKFQCLLAKAPAFGAISPGGQPTLWQKRSHLDEHAVPKWLSSLIQRWRAGSKKRIKLSW